MAIFKKVWEGNAIEEVDFLYYDDDKQLQKLEKLEQNILTEIDAL